MPYVPLKQYPTVSLLSLDQNMLIGPLEKRARRPGI